VEGREEVHKGHGVVWEATVIYNSLYFDKVDNKKFIPVFLDELVPEHVPTPVKGFTFYSTSTRDEYRRLCLRLTGQSGVRKAGFGIRKCGTAQGEESVFSAKHIFARAIE
jgi:hypothetical protein